MPKRKATPRARLKPKAKPVDKPVKKLEPLCGQCGARHPFGTDCDPAQLLSFARVERNKTLIDQAVESQQRILPTRSKKRAARRRPRKARR